MPSGARGFRDRRRVLVITGVLLAPLLVLGIALISVSTRQDKRQDASDARPAAWLEGVSATKANRNRFGIEGPQDAEEAEMAREEALEQPGSAGIHALLRQAAPAQQAPADGAHARDEEPDWLVDEERWQRSRASRPRRANDLLGGARFAPQHPQGGDRRQPVPLGLGGLGTGRKGGGGGKTIGTIGEAPRDAGRDLGAAANGRVQARARVEETAGESVEERVEATVGQRVEEGLEPVPTAADPMAATREAFARKRPDTELDGKLERKRAAPSAARAGRSMRSARVHVGHVGDAADKAAHDDDSAIASPPLPDSAMARLLERYRTLEGVQLRAARGYWQNSYIPGDAALRTLQARLEERAPAALPRLQLAVDPSRSSHRPEPTGDAPQDAALGVYLNASERGVTGRTRMLVQVGLEATPRLGGHRPAMNVGLVLDMRQGLGRESGASVRALLEAFARARDLGDRFSLVVAGAPGGLLVGPEAFRHGPLTVALQRLLDGAAGSAHGQPRGEVHGGAHGGVHGEVHGELHGERTTLDLSAAARRAAEAVAGQDDPGAPLGSSVVIVLTPGRLGAELAPLLQLAHDRAVEGIPLSVIGVGSDVDASELGQLALAGQGNRHLVASAADGAQAVDRELSSVARAVARAVRVRIRLSPGVELVDVLGSRRLDAPETQRVRQAEQSIDLGLARNLGITADRGQDEEGIQIVIPSFYAGDHHSILLDVVVPGPGAVADVSVRYKDLVHPGNGVARDHLALGNRALARGPLQHAVLKGLLAFELSGRLQAAAASLSRGEYAGAVAQLQTARAVLQSADGALPALARDRDLHADRHLIAQYLEVLTRQLAGDERAFVLDSMRLAAVLKLQPRADWDQADVFAR